MNKLQSKNYNKYICNLRKKVTNKDVSIISNNCIGGILYHDLGTRFNSPTINTLIYGDEFVYFASNLKYYLSVNLTLSSNNDYPIGILKSDKLNLPDIHIHFLHDKDFSIAKQNWDKRKQRVNYNNIVVIYEHFNKNDAEILNKFNNFVPYKKVAFTHKKFKNVPCTFYISKCKKEKSFGTITKFKNKFSGKRNIYKFNVAKFINN